MSEAEELITSARQAAAVCGVTRFAVRAWIDRGLLPEPPWTVPQLERTRDGGEFLRVRRRRTEPGQGGHMVAPVRSVAKRRTTMQGSTGKSPSAETTTDEVRQQFLDAINTGRPFRAVLRNLDLTSNRVFGLARTDLE